MTLPIYVEHGYDKPHQREIAKKMNVVLNWLHNKDAPASVKESAKYVCEELAAEKEIPEEQE
jgi:hypothetical protein